MMPVAIDEHMLQHAEHLVFKHFPGLTREQIDSEQWIKDRNRFVHPKGVFHQHLVGYLGELAVARILEVANIPFEHHLAHARKDVGYDVTIKGKRYDVKTREGHTDKAKECAFMIPQGQHEKTDLDGYVAVMLQSNLQRAWVMGTCSLEATKGCPLKQESWMRLPGRVVPGGLLKGFKEAIKEWSGLGQN